MNPRNTGRRRAAALALSAMAWTAAAQPEPSDYRTAIELYLQAGREMARQQQMRAPYVQPPTVQHFTTPGLRGDAWWMQRWLNRPWQPEFPPPHGAPPYSCGAPCLPPPCPACVPDEHCW